MASIIDTTRIVDLPTKASLSEGDVFVVDNENGATSKIPAAAVSGSSTAGLVAEEYSDAGTYEVGEYCIHVEAGIPKLYKCTTAIAAAEAWTPAHWEGTDAGTEFTDLNQNLADLDYGTTSVITPTQVNDYFTAPSMGVVRGYIRKSNTQNAGTFGFKSSLTNEYVYISNITVVDGYVPVEYLMCRGETITFATINELSLSGSKLRFFPLKKRT